VRGSWGYGCVDACGPATRRLHSVLFGPALRTSASGLRIRTPLQCWLQLFIFSPDSLMTLFLGRRGVATS